MSETLELVAATAWFWTFSIGFLVSIIGSLLTLFCPALWYLVPLYLLWILFDRATPEAGGRPVAWVRRWAWWRLVRQHFSHRLLAPGVDLRPERNYLFACFPHGVLPVGTFASFVDQSLFPAHRAFTTALGVQFWMPVVRELFLAVGAVSVSGPSIRHLLRREGGGNIVSILIGGADEGMYSKPGAYKVILKRRKGFVKMALQLGVEIVPVISFGEVDVFDQVSFPGFGVIRDLVKRLTSIGLVIPVGKYGICPNRVPVTTVVGKPIIVGKLENPTNEEIDILHEKFTNQLVQLFEEHKSKYVKNPSKTVLEIV